ncbi:Core-2/I-Branching enzyme [Ancylostoma caninum]|uniref:Core-2/I-Branching enzyme n=1 Tax=Ancylostoma caninum TaxID=29170 RepID=A0A368GIA5_ANCCA|nr:Core-2/I-Branching enzyme [Ancylostoma caninum]
MLEILQDVHECFPNIHVMKRPPLQWGNFEVINTTYACFEYLAKSETPWKYFQYLSGVDAPLKTNLEMVQIFKSLNETVNADIEEFPSNRIKRKNKSPPPLPLVKSSLSILLSRRTVNEMVRSPLTGRLLKYLPQTFIPDESFWVTIVGNPSTLTITGGFDAEKVLLFQKIVNSISTKEYDRYKEDAAPMNAYISRYQVWKWSKCRGKMFRYSCLFGVRDIPILLKQPHLVAHKFYIEYQPASYFCILKSTRQRTFSPVPFNPLPYAEIPYVELSRGVPFFNLTHPEWIMKIH